MRYVGIATASLSLMLLVRSMSATPGASQGQGLNMPGDRPGSASRFLRLDAVPGSQPQRVNDMLLLRPGFAHSDGYSKEGAAEDDSRHVVFFPGDIQNFEQEMAMDKETAKWQSWSYERVAHILSRRFPRHNVWVVRAARIHLDRVSCYCNFVESDEVGVPEYSDRYGAIGHLRALLRHGLERAGILSPMSAFPPPGFSLILVGFSKGCVVLNQMVHELQAAQADTELVPFLQRVTQMYWLDAGHPGMTGRWVTNQQALKTLISTGIRIHVHVTPYQVHDPSRPWKREEYLRFVQILEELGAQFTNTLHFEDEDWGIDIHFKLIQNF